MAWYQRYREPLTALREDIAAQTEEAERAALAQEQQRNVASQILDMLTGAQTASGGDGASAAPPYSVVPLDARPPGQPSGGARNVISRQLSELGGSPELVGPPDPRQQGAGAALPPPYRLVPLDARLLGQPSGGPRNVISQQLSELGGGPELVGPPDPRQQVASQPVLRALAPTMPPIPEALKKYEKAGLVYRAPDNIPHMTTVWDGLKRKVYEAPTRGEWATAPSRDGRILVFDEDGTYLRTERVGDEESKKYQRGQMDVGGPLPQTRTPTYRESIMEQVFRETPEYQRLKAMNEMETALSAAKHRQVMEHLDAKRLDDERMAEKERAAREKDRETSMLLGAIAKNQSLPPELIRYAEDRGIIPKSLGDELLTAHYFPPVTEKGKARARTLGELIDLWADVDVVPGRPLPYQSLRTKLLAQGANDEMLKELLGELANQYNIRRIDTPIGPVKISPGLIGRMLGGAGRYATFDQDNLLADNVPDRDRRKLAVLLKLLNVPGSAAPQMSK